MTDKSEPAKPSAAKSVKDDTAGGGVENRNSSRWVAAGAAMGIGSAALVAALLYTNRDRKDAKPVPKPPPGHAPESD